MNLHIDKNSIKHFGICFALAFAGGIDGAEIALSAGITKEYMDKKVWPYHWCWMDIIVDTLGAGTGLLAHYFAFNNLKWY